MKKNYNSKLLFNKEDFESIYDYKYKYFLPALILLVAAFSAISPVLKGVGFVPIFIGFCVFALIFVFFYNKLNRKIKNSANVLFSEKEFIEINAEFLEDEIKVIINNNQRAFKYNRILKVEEYENFYLVYTNIKGLAVFPVSKNIGELRDNSDFLSFLINTAKPKRKTVKKIKLRKQKAYVCIIVLICFAVATLLPILFLITYNLFDYNYVI